MLDVQAARVGQRRAPVAATTARLQPGVAEVAARVLDHVGDVGRAIVHDDGVAQDQTDLGELAAIGGGTDDVQRHRADPTTAGAANSS